MILKKLEIYGFKSFGKKAEIDFNDNVIAIVGPNGSGKSNITDAIRWVMGEQRVKPLRGSKMEDVIFAGTAEKKPLGYAQVSLTIDNSSKIFVSEYEEINVMRRYYRSGESEYFINKVQCRLKDVQSLFMDTGLGREGYSIVSQGQIESIVVNSPLERKLLIEEAAGIVKYRVRKIEAERKLERAQNNLYRITDIISELEQRLPVLKRQSEKAEKFIELRNRLKEIEVGIFVMRMDILTQRAQKAETDKEAIEESLRLLDEEITGLDERYRILKSKLSGYDSEILAANNDIHELMNKFEFAKVDLQVSKKELEGLLNSREESSKENEAFNATIDDLNREKQSIEAELENNKNSLKQALNAFEEFKSETDKVIGALKENESRLALLEGYENSMQGYKYAVRELIHLKQTNSVLNEKLYTTVGEIIDTEGKYAEAVTKSLGASISYMVTEDEHTAALCIDILKQNKWGRVTFLPKNIVKAAGTPDNERINQCTGFIAFANKLVKCEEGFQGIIDNLLSRVAVCDTLDNANKAAALTGHRHKIVTLDGEVLFPGGAMAGGRTKNEDEGSIKRRSDIEHLKKQIAFERKKYEGLLSENSTADESVIFSLRETVATLSERLRNTCERLTYFNEQKKNKHDSEISAEGKIEQLKAKIEGYSDADEKYTQKRQIAEEKYIRLVAEKEAANKEYNLVNDDIIQKSRDRNGVSEKLSAIEVTLGKTDVEIQHLQNDMMEDYGLTYASAIPYKTEIADIQKSIDELSELKDKIKKLGNINVDSLDEYKQLKERYENMCYQRDDLVASKDELGKVIKDISEKMVKQFLQQFNIIQREFNSVFNKLFSGGEANLVLTDPDDVMNSGVEITARPPYTKLKNIAALSGGEKSMTAISLIFAILRIKPSPFCVLDEIDAALDDANVGRICAYLRSIKQLNQFVIVTHKKSTMEIADTLYGVSMGSDGVSQVLSVKLSDIDDYGE